MSRRLVALLFVASLLPLASPALAVAPLGKRPVATYSIVAHDPDEGVLGVAVQSHWFSVGPIVPWGEAGVGVVATQSLVEVSYGPLGLDLMRAGKTAPEALRALLAGDEHAQVRQVAMVDARGGVAAHSGEGCIPAAGYVTGDGFSVQANLMDRESVWPAMARAFESAEGDLADRMLAALHAAEAEGGDIRGRQSAAILIVSDEKAGAPWQGRLVDLRVEDHEDPLGELDRLLRLHRAYEQANLGDEALTREDTEAALSHYAAARAFAPENHELVFWNAVTLAGIGKVDEAMPLFAEAFEAWPAWKRLLPRLVGVELFPDDAGLLERVLTPAGQGASR